VCGGVGSLALGLLVVLGTRVMTAGARRHRRFVGGFHGGQVGRRLCLAAHLRLALPVVHVNGLGKVAEIREGGGLPDTRDLIFDAVRETIVEIVLEGTFSISSDLQSNPVEFNYVFVDLLTILHRKVVKLMFCISDGIMQTKVHL